MDGDRNVYLSETAWPAVKDYIRRRLLVLFPGAANAGLVEILPSGLTYEAVDSHADLYVCPVGGATLAGAPGGAAYPDNVGYCGVQLGQFFIHNLRLTAPEVRGEVKRLGLTEIHVRQGYTKCNLVVIGPGSLSSPAAVITSDRGVAKALAPYPIDVLVIDSGHVELPGFSCGFLGGASGSLAGEILFNGDLTVHPDCGKICRFIRDRDMEPRWFSGLPLRDIGSIITLL